MKKRVLWSNWVGRSVGVELLWEPRDLWVGVFWDKPMSKAGDRYWVLYLTIIPCLPIRLSWHRHILSLWKRAELRMRERLG